MQKYEVSSMIKTILCNRAFFDWNEAYEYKRKCENNSGGEFRIITVYIEPRSGPIRKFLRRLV